MTKFSLLIITSLFSTICFAGNDTGGSGIIQFLSRASFSADSLLTIETSDGVFSEKITATKFIDVADERILFKVKSLNGEYTFSSDEEILEKDIPIIIDSLEESATDNDWIEI